MHLTSNIEAKVKKSELINHCLNKTNSFKETKYCNNK